MLTRESADLSGLHSCNACGQTFQALVDAAREVSVSEGERLKPEDLLAIARCPSCGKRDRKDLLLVAVPQLMFGALIAGVGWMPFTLLGFMFGPSRGSHAHDVWEQWIFPTTITLSLLTGLGFVVLRMRRACQRADLSVTFDVPDAGAALREPPATRPTLFQGDDRNHLAQIIVFLTAAALGTSRFSGFDFETSTLVIVAVIAACIAGTIRGVTTASRVAFGIAYAVVVLGVLFAVRAYLEGRSSVMKIELLIPTFLGCLPGLITYFVVEHRSERRASGSRP